MQQLTIEQKNLIFDYCIGITSESQAAQVEELIFSNSEAAELSKQIKASLSPLDTVAAIECPDNLVERTVESLNKIAQESQKGLEHLLAKEQIKARTGPKTILLKNLVQLAVAAAIILAFTGTYFPSMRNLRVRSWEQQCEMQLKRVGQGFANYQADHAGLMPSVARADGQPWWKVGYQGKENHSNTRNVWLLAKQGYVTATDFVCPGKRQGRVLKFDPAKAKNYNDFPSRRYITYSFRINSCDKKTKPQKNIKGRRIIMSDLNPLFERLPRNFDKALTLKLNAELLKLNSANHNRRGQNTLFCDGSVKFKTNRTADVTADDIFTLQNTDFYKGTELPERETDAFLAP